MPDINVQDEKGVIHVFPNEATPEMIANVMGVKPPSSPSSQQVLGPSKTGATAPGFNIPLAPKPTEFQKPPVGTPFPSTNPIEKAGQRQDVLGERENRAMQSPTPFTSASAAIFPVSGVGEDIAARGLPAVAKSAAKSVGRSAVKAAATSSVGAGIGATVGGKRGAEIGAGVGLAASPFVPDKALADVPIARRLMFSDEELADILAGQKATQRAADIKAGVKKGLPPPPDPEFVKQKTITEAQEAATAENRKFDASARRSAEKLADERNAAFQKEAEENVAIQKRADDAQAARVQAEKEVKNARLKADVAHEKAMKEIETARQKELMAQERLRTLHVEDIQRRGGEQGKLDKAHADRLAAAEKTVNDAHADTERLRTMHGDDLMKRGREQDALTRAAEDAAKEEESAKAAVVKRAAAKPGVTRPGSSGVRPTETEQTLTRLFKKRVWTPADEVDARNALGPEAVRRPGEGFQKYQARVMGMIRSSRAAIGMEDIESGPVNLPPPPSTSTPSTPSSPQGPQGGGAFKSEAIGDVARGTKAMKIPAWVKGEGWEEESRLNAILNDPSSTPEEKAYAKMILRGSK